jgi:hypothetical protein
LSIDRQFGMHEIPGTEEPAPQKRETVSAGFEMQMRGYVNQIWARIGELDEKLAALSSHGRPTLNADDGGEAKGERSAPPSSSPKPSFQKKPRAPKPWEAEGVSRRTWNRRRQSE